MIGKMYRPIKILSVPSTRGYNLENKYKSNFGKVNKFNLNVSLSYIVESETEIISISFLDIKIPVVMNQDSSKLIDNNSVRTNVAERNIYSLRRLGRPNNISSMGDILEFAMEVVSLKDVNEDEILTIRLQPIIRDNEEYMFVEVESKTPAVIKSNTNVSLI